jgi:hypothetical protein
MLADERPAGNQFLHLTYAVLMPRRQQPGSKVVNKPFLNVLKTGKRNVRRLTSRETKTNYSFPQELKNSFNSLRVRPLLGFPPRALAHMYGMQPYPIS